MRPARTGGDELTVILPRMTAARYLAECWRRREILRYLARRDVILRYRETALGVAWVVLKPIAAVVIFTLVFSRIAMMPSGGVPYPVLALSGMLFWQFFATVVAECSTSVVNNPNLVTKVYFPRILIPLSALAPNLLDLAVNSALMAALMAAYGILPPARIAALPISFAIAAAATVGTALWAASLMVRYRDLKNIIAMILQFGMLASPVAYTVALAPAGWRWWLYANPLSGAIELLRWCLFPAASFPGTAELALSGAVALLLLTSGYTCFRRAEPSFADAI